MSHGGSRSEPQDADRRAALAARRDEVSVVQDDHCLLGFSTLDYGHRRFISGPPITDIVDDALFAALRSGGLEDADARHLMYAVTDNCHVFVTLDTPHFVDDGRREALEACCSGSIRIMLPSEFVASIDSRPAEPPNAGEETTLGFHTDCSRDVGPYDCHRRSVCER